MKNILNAFKNVNSEICITIILNTHRTRPDNNQDPILLKNLIREVEERLLADYSKRQVQVILDNLYKLQEEIDHSFNLESLILFVNEDIAEYVRLPLMVENRVVIDNTFATRDISRSLQMESNYFILVLSRQESRLIEAFNDKVVREVELPDEIRDNELFSLSKADNTVASKERDLHAEYFNRVDKELNRIRNDEPLPVIICTEESNFHEYLKIADEKDSIYDQYVNQNHMNDTAHSIVSESWKIVKEYVEKGIKDREAELKRAVSSGYFLSDSNDIWQAIQQGRIQTIFIEQGNFQPAKWENDQIVYVSEEERKNKDIVDDIYDELIEENRKQGGDVVFLPKGSLADFNGFGAITRF